MSELNLSVIENPKAEETEVLTGGLGDFNLAATGDKGSRRFAIVARDGSGQAVAGTIATIYWGWCYVELLWVRDDLRGQGVGRRLLVAAEDQARGRGIRNIYLDTFSWQALEFYLKHGYTVFGQLENFPPPHTKYYLRKSLSGQRPPQAGPG